MLSFLYVYSHHSILECYNLFSGVELSMRSFFVILNKNKKLGVLFVIRNHIAVKREIPYEKISSMMPNRHHSDSYSGTHSDI